MKTRAEHGDCWMGEPCAIGKPAECPPCLAEAKRDKGRQWSALELRRESGGLRHYLDGRDVHCGDVLALQGQDIRTDDYGDYTHWLQEGRRVRYEARYIAGAAGGLTATLHADLCGHEFVAACEPWMRFRWPEGH